MAYKDGSRLRGGKAYSQKESFKEHIRRRDNYTCQICGVYPAKIVDHIVPYALQPETKPDGVRVLCQACNLATRRARKDSCLPLDEYYKAIELELCRTR